MTKIRRVKDHPGILIHRHPDPRRISGLVAEDRVRTSKMFLKGNVAWRPTDPIDIAAEHDLIQGLPTHVKSCEAKRGSKGQILEIEVHLSDAYHFYLLEGHQRLLVALYEIETWLDENDQKFLVLRYDRIIEVILSPETLAAMRGSISPLEIKRLKDQIGQWHPEKEHIADVRSRFEPLFDALKPRMGIAKPSPKISQTETKRRDGSIGLKPDNRRVQCSVTLTALHAQVQGEDEGDGPGVYRGRIVQDRWIEHDETTGFHGIELPWRTTAKWKKLPKIGTKQFPRPAPVSDNDPHRRYVTHWIGSSAVPIAGGTLVIARHEDGMRSIVTDSPDDEVKKHVSRICRLLGGAWVPAGSFWLVDKAQAVAIVESLRDRSPLPRIDQKAMEHLGQTLHSFQTDFGPVRAIHMGRKDWALRPHPSDENQSSPKAILIAAVCRAYGVGRFHEDGERKNWIVPGDPPDERLVNDVAHAISTFHHLVKGDAA